MKGIHVTLTNEADFPASVPFQSGGAGAEELLPSNTNQASPTAA